MAATVIWTQEALDDIDAIAAYISRDSPFHAQRVIEELFALGESIAAHPKMWRVVPEIGDERVRERFLYSYRVIYEIGKRNCQVLAVIHGKRLLESIQERFSAD